MPLKYEHNINVVYPLGNGLPYNRVTHHYSFVASEQLIDHNLTYSMFVLIVLMNMCAYTNVTGYRLVYHTLVSISYTCTALLYEPAFIATWQSVRL